jgi:pyruvate formate lyase activating enzyme
VELIPQIDLFSISMISMDPEYYRRFTGGKLEPVLDGIKQVYQSGRHLELSTLMITDVSDTEETARNTAEWVLRNLDSSVPVHFVRFHPDFRMTETIRTPVDRLERARRVAMEMGLQHVYLGNVYDTKASNTYCSGCGAELINRYGLNAVILGLDDQGLCTACGTDAHVKRVPLGRRARQDGATPLADGPTRRYDWHGDIRSLHVQALNMERVDAFVQYRCLYGARPPGPWHSIPIFGGESWRFIIAKASEDEVGIEVIASKSLKTNLHEVFDRAHFPTVDIEAGRAASDVTPLPAYGGPHLVVAATPG